jgi:hypothetical protein
MNKDISTNRLNEETQEPAVPGPTPETNASDESTVQAGNANAPLSVEQENVVRDLIETSSPGGTEQENTKAEGEPQPIALRRFCQG